MLCPRCGYYAEGEEIVCPECGEILRRESTENVSGAQAIRQGKRAREAVMRRPASRSERVGRVGRASEGNSRISTESRTAADRSMDGNSRPSAERRNLNEATDHYQEDLKIYGTEGGEDEERGAGFERKRRALYDDEILRNERAEQDALRYEQSRGHRGHMINWVKVAAIVVGAAALMIFAGWFFLNKTEAGQKIMARMGREANSTALWAVGEDRMNEGDIDGAISAFQKARDQDTAEGTVDVDGLLTLGSALEAAGRIDEAAELYEQIYTETPSRTEAYRNHIRILMTARKAGDLAKAGELMKIAYEKTGDSSFNTQRSDLLPAPPEVDLTAGFYEAKKYIAITSYQGYDVYYTFDENAELPAGGILFKERVFLDEGTHNLRAVAVNGELVSDELKGTYKIIMPSPMTPRCNLAPNTYKHRQSVKLKPGKDNENDDDIVIYYTVDGSNPDADSPIYNGEPIWLPNGKPTLKAVAVNKYHKVSNMLEVKYKIEAKPLPLSAYDPATDQIGNIRLNQTAQSDFEKTYGTGKLIDEGPREGFNGNLRTFEYDWGTVTYVLNRTIWTVVEVDIRKNGGPNAPRGTAIGDAEDYVVGKYRDLGQVASASGNRGLYATDNTSGKIWKQEGGGSIIRYRSYADSHWTQLDYHTGSGGKVNEIHLQYIP